ncbi:MAG: hypothetical protein QOI41_6675 [Myxococcales bacterium]|nr:hypothetical protein [Myxococcales bacterium]
MAASLTSSDSARPPSPPVGAEPARVLRSPVARRPAGMRSLLVLGMSLARRGVLPVASIAICISTTLALSLIAGVLTARGPQSPAHEVPLLASSALAWGGGFLLAFAAAAHALRRDRTEGIRDLFVARTTSLRGYLLARIGGLALLIALCVAGGTLVVGLVGIAGAARASGVPSMLQATGAGIVFSLAFSAVVAPVSFAALGARSRLGGYVFLIAVVTIPEVIVGLMGSSLPESVADVLSIPSALAALRTSLAPGTLDLWRTVRALVALSVVVAFAMFLVRRDTILVDAEDGA